MVKWVALLLTAIACQAQPAADTEVLFFSKLSSPQPVIDSNAIVFFTKLGGVSSTITNAIDTFVKTLKSDGTWTNFDCLYPNVGANIGSNGVNLISTNYYASIIGTPTQSDATGTTGNGSTFALNTTWVLTNQNTFSEFADIYTNGTQTSSAWVFGSFGSATFTAFSLQIQTATSMAPFMCTWYGGANDNQNNPTFPAVFVGSRTGSTNYSIYWNSNQLTGLNTISASPNPNSVYVFCGHNDSGITRPWNGRMRCWGFGNRAMSGFIREVCT